MGDVVDVEVSVPADGWPTIVLLGLDLALWRASTEHHAALYREIALIGGAGQADKAHVPGRLVALVDRLTNEFAGPAMALDAVLRQALAEGRTSIDVAVPISPRAARTLREFQELMDEVVQFSASGALLTVTPPYATQEFRRWYLGQFSHQLEGGEPVSWSEWRATRPDPPSTGP
jgi:hypothetical protein